MKTPRDLAARYSYQFDGENFGIAVTKGWFPLFSRLCSDVDELLGENKQLAFRWLNVKEKSGVCRILWAGSKPPNANSVELIKSISALVRATSEQTAHTCAVCGAPGAQDRLDGYVLTLCPAHVAVRREEPSRDLGMSFPTEDDFPPPAQSLKNLIEDGRA